jgi:NTE family protein
VQLGWQYEAFRNLFFIPRVNAAVYDLNGKANPKYKYVTGYGITAGFASRLGPMEATVMYSDQASILKGYVNLGFHF